MSPTHKILPSDGYEDDDTLKEELDLGIDESSIPEFLDENDDFPFPPQKTPRTDDAKKERFMEILRRIRDDPLCSFTINIPPRFVHSEPFTFPHNFHHDAWP